MRSLALATVAIGAILAGTASAQTLTMGVIAGMWADRDDIDEIREGMRAAGRRKMKQLYPDYGSEADDADDRR